jgi:hypothetical protein
MSELLLDAAGRRRSPATLPQFHAGRPPRNKGMRYPADPPAIEEIVAVMRRGKGGRRREVGMDDWAWEQLAPWLQARVELPVGPLFCFVNDARRGRPWGPPPRARSSDASPARQECGDASRAPTPARGRRWPARACR